jgi:hypothetical protein
MIQIIGVIFCFMCGVICVWCDRKINISAALCFGLAAINLVLALL